jgi:hypothetical protein
MEKVIEKIRTITNLETLTSLKPGIYEVGEDFCDGLGRDRKELRKRIKDLRGLWKELCEIYKERTGEVVAIKELMYPLYKNKTKDTQVSLVGLHRRLGILKAERKFISTLLKHTKVMGKIMRSGIGGIDGVIKDRSGVSKVLIAFVCEGRYQVTKYIK